MRNIVRVLKGQQAHFSIIANQPVKNKSLSYKARGILWLCLTRPDDWRFNAQYLINMSEKDGRDAVKSGLKELEEAGYMFRRSIRDPETGQWAGSVWLVFEYPWQTLGYQEAELTEAVTETMIAGYSDETPQTGFPATVHPSTGQPLAGNPPLLKTDSVLKTDSTNNGEKKGADAPPASQPSLNGILDPEQSTAFSNELDHILASTLRDEAKAAGLRGPRSFETMAQKEAWRAAAETIVKLKGESELHEAINWALVRGRRGRGAVIATVEAWAENLRNPKPYGGNGSRQNKVMTRDRFREWARDNVDPSDPSHPDNDTEIPETELPPELVGTDWELG